MIILLLLAVSTVAAPVASAAPPAGKGLRIGVLNAERFPPAADPRMPFFIALKDFGWIDGRTVRITEVSADGDLQRCRPSRRNW